MNVTPAKVEDTLQSAGVQGARFWIPAFAGMTLYALTFLSVSAGDLYAVESHCWVFLKLGQSDGDGCGLGF